MMRRYKVFFCCIPLPCFKYNPPFRKKKYNEKQLRRIKECNNVLKLQLQENIKKMKQTKKI